MTRRNHTVIECIAGAAVMRVLLPILFLCFGGNLLAALNDNLIGWWKLDEGTGALAADSSGNGNTGILTNGTSWADGGVSFDGVNGQIHLPVGATTFSNANWSVAFWIRHVIDSPRVEAAIFGEGNSVAAGFAYIDTLPEATGANKGKLSFGSDEEVGTMQSDTATANAWEHRVATFDGTTLRWYRNGATNGTKTPTAFTQANTDRVTLGALRYNGSANYAPFKGKLSNVRTYSRAISAGEVTEIFNLGFGSSGSEANIQFLIDAASDGDTITIPAGAYDWSDTLTISGKGIKLQGGGSGRVLGRSASSVAVGTGAKTFTTQSGLSISAGQTLQIDRLGGEISAGQPTGNRVWMRGTVTSYSGSSLVMNITATSSTTGTHPLWIISSEATTTITNSYTGTLLSLTEDASHTIEISGLRFVGDMAVNVTKTIKIDGVTGGRPVQIHDCYFSMANPAGNTTIWATVSRGIIYNCSFAAQVWCESCQPLVIFASSWDAWTTLSTLGTNDVTGTNNFYVEDSDFHGILNSVDCDDNTRLVWRYSTMNNAGCGSHGADTATYGARHYEFYNNTTYHNGYSDGQTLPLGYSHYLRGGTGVFTDNVYPSITSQDYPNKPTWNMTVMNLQRSAGPNPCYGANVVGNQYPAPRQVGQGRVTGANTNDSATYAGDSEPIYIWNNSGAGTNIVGISDYGGGDCTSPDSSVDYIIEGRDYIYGAKPNYAKFTYPHPLRASGGGGGGGSETPAARPPVVRQGRAKGWFK